MSDRDPGSRKLPVASGYSGSRILEELADEDQFDYDDHDDDDDVNVDHVDGYDVEDNCNDKVVEDFNGTCDVIDDDDDDDDGERLRAQKQGLEYNFLLRPIYYFIIGLGRKRLKAYIFNLERNQ